MLSRWNFLEDETNVAAGSAEKGKRGTAVRSGCLWPACVAHRARAETSYEVVRYYIIPAMIKYFATTRCPRVLS
jgi:hypothetical protein